jgi:PAS domain S-box-containing protein
VLKTGKPHHWEVTTEDGTVIDANDYPFKDLDGSPLILEMDLDITEQRRASHYTRSLIEASLDPLVTINPDGKITDLNEATSKATGLSRNKLIGTDFANYFTDPEKAQEGYRLVFSKGMVKDFPLTVRHKNGKLTDVLYNASIYSDARGKELGVFAAARDITLQKLAETELKKRQEDLQKLNEDLLRSNKELESFAYVASHDLQEPLRMVTSFTQLLAKNYKDQLDESAKEYISFAVEGANRMYNLINGLLDYSRISKKETYFSTVDLNKVIEQVKANLDLIIKEKNCVIDKKSLPVIKADSNQMIQLFQNLIANGIKFSLNNPHITISAKRDKSNYLFSVKDEGIGIESQYYDKIFEIFKRLHTRDQFEGTGIGLTICKRIVENHKGKIWVESVPGQGSVFYFTIPDYITNKA